MSPCRQSLSKPFYRERPSSPFLPSWLIIIALVFLFTDSSQAATPVLVGGELGYPPYSTLTPEGAPAGFNTELTRQIAAKMGLDVTLQIRPWPEVKEALAKGEIDVIQGMFYSENRARVFDFSPPFATINHAIFCRKDSPAFNAIEDLRNQKVIVVQGDIMHDYAEKIQLTKTLLQADTLVGVLEQLAAGEGDYALLARLPGLFWLNELGLSDHIRAVGPPIMPAKYCYAVRKGNTDLLSQFTEGLNLLHATGEYREIYEKNLGGLEPIVITGRVVARYAAIFFGPLLLLLIASLLWSWIMRKKVRQRTLELQSSKDEWERTFDAITDPVMILDLDFRIVRANKVMAEALAVKPQAAIGLTCYKSVHGTQQPVEQCPHAMLLRDGQARSVEIYEPRIGGYCLVTVSPLFSADGKLAGSIHAAKNITQMKEAEQRLQEDEKKLHDITASLGEGLYVLDRDCRLTFINPEGERLLGWSQAELLDKEIHPIIHNRKADGSPLPFEQCSVHQVIKSGARFSSQEEVFVRQDGSVFPVSILSTPIMDSAGKPTSSITAFRDITARKQIEQEREGLIAELQAALAEIKTLKGIVPICMHCKKIRDDAGYWNQLEKFISEHSDAQFSHGICEECLKKHYPEEED